MSFIASHVPVAFFLFISTTKKPSLSDCAADSLGERPIHGG